MPRRRPVVAHRLTDPMRRGLWVGTSIPIRDLRQLAWNAEGTHAAALVVLAKEGTDVWRIAIDGSAADQQRVTGRASFPAFTSTGEIACIVDARLAIPCHGTEADADPDLDVYGPIAFYASTASISPHRMTAAWSSSGRPTLALGHARRVSSFAPRCVRAVGRRRWHRRVQSAVVSHASRRRRRRQAAPTRQLTTFQSETPSYHPTQPADRIHLWHVAARR